MKYCMKIEKNTWSPLIKFRYFEKDTKISKNPVLTLLKNNIKKLWEIFQKCFGLLTISELYENTHSLRMSPHCELLARLDFEVCLLRRVKQLSRA